MRRSLALALVLAPAVALAQAPPNQAQHATGLTAYRRAVVLLESHKGSVEQVFYRGLFVRDLLLKPDSRGTALVETLSSTEYDALRKEFSGFIVGRDEVVFANPDPAYFLELARNFGDAADVAFFDAYRRTRPEGIWPVWTDVQTDVSGCTKFGDGSLVEMYRVWSDYRQKYPHRYRSETDAFLAAIEGEAAGGTCACGDAASVLHELEAFDRAYPQTRVGDLVRRRIQDLRADRSQIRFACTSGPANRILR